MVKTTPTAYQCTLTQRQHAQSVTNQFMGQPGVNKVTLSLERLQT